MKTNINILLFIALSCFATAQDKIDPNNLFVPGTVFEEFKNDHFVSNPNIFVRGWNWTKPGAVIDSAVFINFHHGSGLGEPDYIKGSAFSQPTGLLGRVDDCLLNANAYYYNPCIVVDSSAYFTPGPDHLNGRVFGFKNKYLGTVNNHAFCLSKSSVSSPTLVLDGLWTDEPIHFINHITTYGNKTWNMPLLEYKNQNGYRVYLTVNLQCPDTIPDNLLDSTVLTLTVPYEKWHYTYVINGSDTILTSSVPTIIPGLLAKFSSLPQATSSIADDTLAMISSYDPTDYRGVERKMVDSTPTTEFKITGKMLKTDITGANNKRITLSAELRFDKQPLTNPLLKPDNYNYSFWLNDHVGRWNIQAKYHGNLDLKIYSLKFETPRAKEVLSGRLDAAIADSIILIKRQYDSPTINPAESKISRFYLADELIPMQWAVNRYANLMLDTLGTLETGASSCKATPAIYTYALGFKEFWSGDNATFKGECAAPYIRMGKLSNGFAANGRPATANNKGTLGQERGYAGYAIGDNDFEVLDSLNSDYETYFFQNNTRKFGQEIKDFSIYYLGSDSSRYIWEWGTQILNEKHYFSSYFNSRIMYQSKPWWTHIWATSGVWDRTDEPNRKDVYCHWWASRQITGEELRKISTFPLLMGAKGIMVWFKNTTLKGGYFNIKELALFPSGFTPNGLQGDALLYWLFAI